MKKELPTQYIKNLSRDIRLTCSTPGFATRTVYKDITQHDLMRVMCYIKPHNLELYNKFKKFIDTIDQETNEFTDWDIKVPRRVLFRKWE